MRMLNYFVFYGAWILLSLFLLQTGRWIPSVVTAGMGNVFILMMLLGLSFVSRHYQLRIEPSLKQRLPQRLLVLAVCVLIFGSGYTMVTLLGIQGNLISAIHTANLLFFACVLGSWLTEPLKRPAELIPLCLVMSLIDIFSVFQGPTRELTSNLVGYYGSGQPGPPPLVDYILIKLPLPGQSSLLPVFGVSDWIMIVMLSAAAAKFGMNDNILHRFGKVYFPVAAMGLVATILAARELDMYLPALPMIAVCFLAVMSFKFPEVRHLTRNELRPMALFTAFAGGLFVIARL
ncbi:hypothetical protein [Desulfosediminicola flagellatus]|uniref:hypothetical protein n=1 Tax=Desulfosediminicola flagellatus TaxID=2569541 RepID=UPI0010AC2F4A|nr:hypothetical protein [Desulfosediminicola flagellatus]